MRAWTRDLVVLRVHIDVLVFCLLYADDLALMDTTAAGLQLSLGRLFEWCRLNHIDMHLDKSKVVVFHPD